MSEIIEKVKHTYTYVGIFQYRSAMKLFSIMHSPPIATQYYEQAIKPHFKFEYVAPDLGGVRATILRDIDKLNQVKIDVYKNDLGGDNFKEYVAVVGGMISGESRSMRTHYMMHVLRNFQKQSPILAAKFSLKHWREFCVCLFDKAPAKAQLLTLFPDEGKPHAGRITLTGRSSYEMINMMLEDHSDMITKIKTDYNEYFVGFGKAVAESRKFADNAIDAIKKARREDKEDKAKAEIKPKAKTDVKSKSYKDAKQAQLEL